MVKSVWMLPKTKGRNSLSARLDDLRRQAERSRRQVNSLFLDEAERAQARKILGKHCLYREDGGYPEAERCRIAFLYEEADFVSSVVCLTARINQKFVQLSHRDVLGALMGLNLERNQFGDLFVLEDRIVIFCTETMADVVIMNCRKIHRLNVEFERCTLPFEGKRQREEKTINVASLRLDNVVAALVPCARLKAAEMIRSGRISINHEMIEDCGKMCHNKDTVSISGVGRFLLEDEGRISRKERRIIKAWKYR